ncbi:hypothetical protein [Saccharibacillus kuerlensis]|uniref:Uncharacterized protein n=1 Tax=Saccharibacillus kuerlensis TaxID=459527 RepID=A0ABQ2KSD4_9BACL|nr:hypothetical protein [Saccharibacillus kuerlensis]GGN91829.1 hypothetical protein GCM10010969_03690 [Saccharibacillus kuerlensis]
MPQPVLIIILLAVLLVNIALVFFFKGKNKTDKGFQFLYYKLNYRRRMIRDLILFPIVLIILFMISYNSAFLPVGSAITFTVVYAVISGIYLAYNFRMWQKHEKIV